MARHLSRTCDGCSLFAPSATIDHSSCSTCPRGGFICQGRRHVFPDTCTTSDFLACAIELLSRSLSTCGQIDCQSETQVEHEAGQIRDKTSSTDQDSTLSADWSQLHLRYSSIPLQLQMLDLVLNLDQRLDHLAQRRQQRRSENRDRTEVVSSADGQARPMDYRRDTNAMRHSSLVRRTQPTLESVEEGEEGHDDGLRAV